MNELIHTILTMDVAAPEIEGMSEASVSEQSKEASRIVLEQAKEMDLPPALPVESTPNYPDTVDTPERVKEANSAVVNQETLSAKRAANLAKARQAKAEKRKAAKDKDLLPDGSPAPNVLADLQTSIHALSGRWQQMESMLQDIQKRVAYETPLQQNQVTSSRSIPVKVPNASETYVDSGFNDEELEGDYSPVRRHKRGRDPRISDMEEVDRYRKRNKSAFDSIFFSNKQVEQRARQPSNGGQGGDNKPFIW